ncbi:MAG: hypothetical protein EOP45_13590 [Sphingobacteriaceae bacterium]|nr:MAG: hypothetical protein EOP45_13590 [Sphingobacteriaceae bacterium]
MVWEWADYDGHDEPETDVHILNDLDKISTVYQQFDMESSRCPSRSALFISIKLADDGCCGLAELQELRSNEEVMSQWKTALRRFNLNDDIEPKIMPAYSMSD